MDPKLTKLFRPRVVAVVGASRAQASVGGAVLRNLIQGGFAGTVYPVNPSAQHVQSVKAYPTLSALPEVPDLVVVAVPSAHVKAVIEEAAGLRVGAAVILSAGFGELGEEGRRAEEELVRIARAAGMRLLGPNCLGVQNLDPAVRLNATFATTFGEPGNIAFASQSGALGLAALDHARELGIGFSAFGSLGNKADLKGTDLLEYFEEDPTTRTVLLYLESFGNPARFREVASRVARRKPIVLVKSGRTGAGARAAGSHTGAMVGPDDAVTALCVQSGILRVDTLETLFDVAVILAEQPAPEGRQVAVVTNAGGPGILAADALEASGLVVPHLSRAAQDRLRPIARPEASLNNPIDLLADCTPQAFAAGVEAALGDPAIHAVVALYVPPITGEAVEIARGIAKAAQGAHKPVVTCFLGTFGVPEAIQILHQARVPVYRFPEQAARALGLAATYIEWRESLSSPPEEVPPPPTKAQEVLAKARARLGKAGGWLRPEEAAALGDAWGLDLAPAIHVQADLKAVATAAEELGYPLVLKAELPGVVHKTEHGAVAVGLRDLREVETAVARLLPQDPLGFLLQPMIESGVEWLVGAVRHPVFGPLISVGAGGTETELRADLHHRLAPLSARDVEALLHTPRIGRTLGRWRGKPPTDAAALEKFIRQFARCAVAHPEIGELEANPVIVRRPGQGAVAVDLRVHLLPA